MINGAAPELLAIMVDGKAVRGATDAEGNQVHLLAAATHDDALVVGEADCGESASARPLLGRKRTSQDAVTCSASVT